MLLRDSPSSRFPYTTLFRSSSAFPIADSKNHAATPPPSVRCHSCGLTYGGIAVISFGPVERDAKVLTNDAAADKKGFFREDRKSTRLNSSHQIISYAVFCLK